VGVEHIFVAKIGTLHLETVLGPAIGGVGGTDVLEEGYDGLAVRTEGFVLAITILVVALMLALLVMLVAALVLVMLVAALMLSLLVLLMLAFGSTRHVVGTIAKGLVMTILVHCFLFGLVLLFGTLLGLLGHCRRAKEGRSES
jgi:hypothetical protein